MGDQNRSRATLIGFGAVVLWSLLALMTVGSAPVPPLQLNAICFAIGGTIGLVWAAVTGTLAGLRAVRWQAYAYGTAGLFLYHALYFSALRLAPAAEAGLIAYLWPLLIVLLAPLVTGERLRAGYVLGALVSFAGAALIVARSGVSFQAGALPGYGLALLCAVVWAVYSTLSRRMGAVPTAGVAVYCLATALLSLLAHLTFEATLWPISPLAWFSIAGLGVGPVGIAFYLWDIGVKRGNLQLLGVASYAAPLLSTLALVATGNTQPTATLLVAAVLIVAGALVAARTAALATIR